VNYKVLFSAHSTRQYLGPFTLYACAVENLSGKNYLATLNFPFYFGSDPKFLESNLIELLRKLKSKIPHNNDEWTFFSQEPILQTHSLEEKKILALKDINKIPTLLTAKKLIESHFESQKKLLSLEYPMIEFEDSSFKQDLKTIKQYGPLGLYDLSHPELKDFNKQLNQKPKLLLHICCGPDAGGVISQLKNDFDLHAFWYDPNIQPKEEYDLRLDAFKKVAEIEEVPYTIGEYDVDRFFEKIKGLEHTPEQGAKCSQCYDMRLERSAIEAKNLNCEAFCSTLAISPHKVQKKLQVFGELAAKKHGVPYYTRNFMKEDGFKNSIDYSNENKIYRQDYCGCYFSLYQGGTKAKRMAKELGYLPKAT